MITREAETTPAAPRARPLLDAPMRPLAIARLFAAAIVLVYVMTYNGLQDFVPSDFIRTAALLVVSLMVATSVVHLTDDRRWRLGPGQTVALDTALVTALLWLYSIEPRGYLFVLVYLLFAEAAILLRPRHAVVAWAAATLLYIVRDVFAATVLDVPVSAGGVLLRVGAALGLAVLLGSLVQAARATKAYASEHDEAQRLRAEDEMKTAFLAAVSHDLKNPLTAILGFATTLRSRVDRMPLERSKEFLDHIVTSARKLERMLGDLLDIDKIERGTLSPNLQQVDAAALVRRVVEETDALGHAVFVHADEVPAEIDAPKVERIVENLLVNAAKYTPADEPIDIYVASDGGDVVVTVEDRGEGVPDDLKEKLFQPFQRAPDANSRATGSGLGLSLVAKFAELHGGRVWVEDRDGGGAAFCVRLPASARR